jgi:hypothetical protein
LLRDASGKVRGWMSFMTAVMLAFYIAYIPLHVFLEEHTHVELSDSVETEEHHADEEHDDDHVPHAADDHALQFAAKGKAPVLFVAMALFTLEFQLEPDIGPLNVFPEVFKVPEEPAPDPLQPRAPPLA